MSYYHMFIIYGTIGFVRALKGLYKPKVEEALVEYEDAGEKDVVVLVVLIWVSLMILLWPVLLMIKYSKNNNKDENDGD